MDKPVLIIDGMNLFKRMLAAHPGVRTDGTPAGGTCGFLSALRYYINDIEPSNVVVAWENGPSQYRTNLYSEYKKQKTQSTIKEREEHVEQLTTITRVLKETPICQLYIPGVEGDDIVAFLCNVILESKKKIIISTDKDFYQLVNDNTIIYSPVKKVFVDHDIVVRDYMIVPQNFSVYKSLCGDKSDNIVGIKGVGPKSFVKLFPNVSLKKVSVNDIYDVCVEHRKIGKLYSRIIDGFEMVKLNWQLTQLEETVLTCDQSSLLIDAYNNQDKTFYQENFQKILVEERLADGFGTLSKAMLHLHFNN